VKVEDEIQLTDLACPHHTNSNMMQQNQALAKTQDFYSMKKPLINSIFTFFWPVEGQAVHDPEETGSHKLKWKGLHVIYFLDM
jgi:hypothetical protein